MKANNYYREEPEISPLEYVFFEYVKLVIQCMTNDDRETLPAITEPIAEARKNFLTTAAPELVAGFTAPITLDIGPFTLSILVNDKEEGEYTSELLLIFSLLYSRDMICDSIQKREYDTARAACDGLKLYEDCARSILELQTDRKYEQARQNAAPEFRKGFLMPQIHAMTDDFTLCLQMKEQPGA